MLTSGRPRHKIAVLCCKDYPQMHSGDSDLLTELEKEENLRVECCVWNDPQVSWSDYVCTIIRSPWDYHLNLQHWVPWFETTGLQTFFLNPPSVISWNANKNYLTDLTSSGASVVPTVFIKKTSNPSFSSLDELIGAGRFELWGKRIVIKPCVSASGYQTAVLGEGEWASPESLAWALRLVAEGDVMAQPFLPTAVSEHSLYFIDGTFSHAGRKSPSGASLARVQGGRPHLPSPTECARGVAVDLHCESALGAPASARAFAQSILDIAARRIVARQAQVQAHTDEKRLEPPLTCTHPTAPEGTHIFPFLYARVDLFDNPDTERFGPSPFLLSELEVFEPFFSFNSAPGSARRLVDALQRHLAVITKMRRS